VVHGIPDGACHVHIRAAQRLRRYLDRAHRLQRDTLRTNATMDLSACSGDELVAYKIADRVRDQARAWDGPHDVVPTGKGFGGMRSQQPGWLVGLQYAHTCSGRSALW